MKNFIFIIQLRNGFNFGIDIESIHETMLLHSVEEPGAYDVNGLHFRIGFIEFLLGFAEPLYVDKDSDE